MGVSRLPASDCAELLGTCEYYQCMEKKEKCGKDGYFVEFGLHYCGKYQKEEYKYTERGKQFLKNVRLCLQDELEREFVRAGKLPKCSKIKKFAIETHKRCYTENKFCELSEADQRHVKLAAKKEILDYQFLKFALWIEKSCD